MTNATQETQKEILDRLYKQWSEAPWGGDDAAFAALDKYMTENNLTIRDVSKIRYPDVDIDAIAPIPDLILVFEVCHE